MLTRPTTVPGVPSRRPSADRPHGTARRPMPWAALRPPGRSAGLFYRDRPRRRLQHPPGPRRGRKRRRRRPLVDRAGIRSRDVPPSQLVEHPLAEVAQLLVVRRALNWTARERFLCAPTVGGDVGKRPSVQRPGGLLKRKRTEAQLLPRPPHPLSPGLLRTYSYLSARDRCPWRVRRCETGRQDRQSPGQLTWAVAEPTRSESGSSPSGRRSPPWVIFGGLLASRDTAGREFEFGRR